MASKATAEEATLLLEASEQADSNPRESKPCMHWGMRLTVVLSVAIALVASAALFQAQPHPFAQPADLQRTVDLVGSVDDSDLILIEAVYAAWGKGKFNGINATLETERFFGENVVTDAKADMKNTDIYKVYNGISGSVEWCKNLLQFKFSDFEPTFIPLGAGKVVVHQSYTATVTSTGKTGPKFSDTVLWTISSGKVSAIKFYWGNVAGMDDLFDTHEPLDIVKAAYTAWGNGKFNGNRAGQELSNYFTKDCVLDASAPGMKNTDIYAIYKGIGGIMNWCNNLKQFNWTHFMPTFIKAGTHKVLVQQSYTPTIASTGNKGPEMSDTVTFAVKAGKISAVKFYWGNAAGVDELLDPRAPLTVVKAAFAAWGEGKFNGNDSRQEMLKYMSEDCVFDASANMKNTGLGKIYQGIAGMLLWCQNLALIQFNDFEPAFRPGPNSMVYVYTSYTATVKATAKTGLKMHDMHEWTVQNGKITSGKFFWGDPKGIDQLFVHNRTPIRTLD